MFSKNVLTFTLQSILVPALLYICKNAYVEYYRPIVLTSNGWVRGITSGDGDHDAFLGIPYAKVREDNPFGAAVPYPKYDHVFEAVDDTKSCPQLGEISETIGGSLDCLTVNIYVPKQRQTKLPVMAYIFGGRFLFGYSGTFHGGRVYGPEYFGRYGVIYVVFNHRVGPYGYLCLGTPEVPGNAGLKDQILALRWIKENIEAFGGDPDKITAFGHSSGAIGLDFHLNYLTEDLFHQAILQSGAITMPTSLESVDRSIPIKLAAKLGFKTDHFQEAVEYLSKQSTSAVIEADTQLKIQHRPCLEKEIQGVDNYITKYPKDIVPNVKNKRILMGHTRDEAGVMVSELPAKHFENRGVFEQYIASTFKFETSEEFDEMSAVIKRYYIGDNATSRFKDHAVNASSDVACNYPMHRQLERFFKHGADKIYLYVFSYSGGRNLNRILKKSNFSGATHADELGYMYEPSFFTTHSDRDDMLLVDRITSLWTNFAKYGDPTAATSEILPVKWLPISKDNRAYLVIDKHMRMDTDMLDRMEFWRDLFMKHSKNVKDNLQT